MSMTLYVQAAFRGPAAPLMVRSVMIRCHRIQLRFEGGRRDGAGSWSSLHRKPPSGDGGATRASVLKAKPQVLVRRRSGQGGEGVGPQFARPGQAGQEARHWRGEQARGTASSLSEAATRPAPVRATALPATP